MVRIIMFVGFLLLGVSAASATEQEWDAIVVDGDRLALRESPLHAFLVKMQPRPRFDFARTSNWSGYSCCWEVRDSKLYLTEFLANIDGKPVDPATIFDGKTLPIHASWYTGKLTVLEQPERPSRSGPLRVEARLYLLDGGNVKQFRRVESLRVGLPWGRAGFKLQRVDKLLVVATTASEEVPEIVNGDIVRGILDPNGFSLTFTDESAEIGNIVLSGDVGSKFMVVVSSPDEPEKRRVVVVKRKDLMLPKGL